MQIFTRTPMEGEEENMDVGKLKSPPNSIITLQEFNEICMEKLERVLNDETLELIFYVFDKPTNLNNAEIDFNLFARLFYLIYKKNELVNLDDNDEFLINSEGDNSKIIKEGKDQFNEYSLSKLSHEDKKIEGDEGEEDYENYEGNEGVNEEDDEDF